MKIITSFLRFAFPACLFSSCIPGNYVDPTIVPEYRQKDNLYYASSSPNTPMLTEKYDLSGNARISTGKNYTSVEFQTAFMPAKHLGIISNYSVGNVRSATYFTFNRFEAGLGYVLQVGPNQHFETYAGYGTGKLTNEHSTGSSAVKNNYFFVQPTIVFSSPKKTVQFALVSKITGNHFNVTDTSFDHQREPLSASQVLSLQQHPFHFFWEPGFVFRAGSENILFHVGYSFSTDLTNDAFYHAKDNFSLGIDLRFNTGKKGSIKAGQ